MAKNTGRRPFCDRLPVFFIKLVENRNRKVYEAIKKLADHCLSIDMNFKEKRHGKANIVYGFYKTERIKIGLVRYEMGCYDKS